MQPCLIFWTGLGMRLTHNLSCICIIKPWTPSHKVSFVLNWSNSVKNAYQYCRLTILDIYLSWSRWRWWVSCVLKWKLHELCYTICNLGKISYIWILLHAFWYMLPWCWCDLFQRCIISGYYIYKIEVVEGLGRFLYGCLMQLAKCIIHNHCLFSLSATRVTTPWLKQPICFCCDQLVLRLSVCCGCNTNWAAASQVWVSHNDYPSSLSATRAITLWLVFF